MEGGGRVGEVMRGKAPYLPSETLSPNRELTISLLILSLSLGRGGGGKSGG